MRTTTVKQTLPTAFALAMISNVALAGGAPIPPSGSSSYATYFTGHVLDINTTGENAPTSSFSEATGITKSSDGQKIFDGLVVHCLIHGEAEGKTVKYTGSCLDTDADGDKFLHTFEGGADSGTTKMISGTGKYAGMHWNATYATSPLPSAGQGQFSFSAEDKATWESK
jgi:hypothetical protein